jgi:hypothetical protein
MTIQELNRKLQSDYGIEKAWPRVYIVDAETYGNVCQAIFDNMSRFKELSIEGWTVKIFVGESNGIMFKNIELLLRK